MKRRRLLLLLVALLLTLAGAEWLLGLSGFLPRPRSYPGEHENREARNFVADEITGWRMRPDHKFGWAADGRTIYYHSDERGFRSAPPRRRAPHSAAASKLVVIGDSFTFGTGVSYEETFAVRLAQQLNLEAVHNLAMPGFGVDQMLLSLPRALELDPVLVVVGVFLDDFERSFHSFRIKEGFCKPSFKLLDGQLTTREASDRPAGWLRLLERNCSLFAAGRLAWQTLGRRRGVGGWWRLNAACIAAMQEACSERGVALLVVYIPAREWQPFPALQGFAAERELAYVDLQAVAGREPVGSMYLSDGHFNATGHEFVAAAIADQLQAGSAED
jgi:hypothetical protein